MALRITGLTLLLLGAIGCANAEQSALQKQLLGAWQWTGTSGGIAGDTSKPAEDDPPKTIEFAAGSQVVYRTGDKETRRARFRLTMEKSIFSGRQAPALTLQNGSPPQIINISKDGQTLTLSDNVYDGFSQTYQRAPAD